MVVGPETGRMYKLVGRLMKMSGRMYKISGRLILTRFGSWRCRSRGSRGRRRRSGLCFLWCWVFSLGLLLWRLLLICFFSSLGQSGLFFPPLSLLPCLSLLVQLLQGLLLLLNVCPQILRICGGLLLPPFAGMPGERKNCRHVTGIFKTKVSG